MNYKLSAETARAHQRQTRVEPDHVDFMGHVNNAEYLRWAQETILEYWHFHAPRGATDLVAWVAIEHSIKYRRPAFEDDVVDTQITVRWVKGARACFDIRFSVNGKVVAEMESILCCVDSWQRKPMRVSDSILSSFMKSELICAPGC